MDTLHTRKTQIMNDIQDYFNECQIFNETFIQKKCETDLELRTLISTVRDQEKICCQQKKDISELETKLLQKDKQIHEYSELIKNFEDKVHELMIEKEENDRFDIIRVQANTISEKEKEIERLTEELNKNENKQEKNVLTMIDMIENNVSNDDDDISITVIKNDKEESDKEESDKEESDKEESDKEESDKGEEDDYEILTYRKKEYWIKKGEDPQIVYEVLDDDHLGNRLGIYQQDKKGKMKVFLDKK